MLYCVCRIVTFMKALSLAVGLMDTAIPMDMKIATTTILALGSEVTGLTGVYKVDIQEKSEEILLGGVIAHQTRRNWVPEQDMEAVCNFADKQALTRQL